jgi:hypothetical protein
MMTPRTRRLALAAVILWFGSAAGGRAEAGIILKTPAELKPGEPFRFAFVTDGSISPTSTNIATYNNFVNAQAGGATYNASVVSWVAIGSTARVNAIDNVGQSDAPMYLADGTLVTSSTTATGMWSGSLQNGIDEDLSGASLKFFGVWTGTTPSGVASRDPLGNFFDVTDGDSGKTNANWVQLAAFPSFLSERMYGISEVLVASGSVPEPSTLLMVGPAIGAGSVTA